MSQVIAARKTNSGAILVQRICKRSDHQYHGAGYTA